MHLSWIGGTVDETVRGMPVLYSPYDVSHGVNVPVAQIQDRPT